MMQTLIANLPMLLSVLLGMALIIVEVFLPGFGLPGIAGIVLIGMGVIVAGVNFGPVVAMGILLVIIAILAVLVSWVLRHVSRSGAHSELFLSDTQDLDAKQEDMKVLIGRCGVAQSMLRPAGIGDFDGVRLNVVTEGGFIETGSPIEIISVDANRILVRAAKEEQ